MKLFHTNSNISGKKVSQNVWYVDLNNAGKFFTVKKVGKETEKNTA